MLVPTGDRDPGSQRRGGGAPLAGQGAERARQAETGRLVQP